MSTIGKVVVVMSKASKEISNPEIRRSQGLLVTGRMYPSGLPCPPYLRRDSGVVTDGLGSSVGSRISPKEKLGDIIWLKEKVKFAHQVDKLLLRCHVSDQ